MDLFQLKAELEESFEDFKLSTAEKHELIVNWKNH